MLATCVLVERPLSKKVPDPCGSGTFFMIGCILIVLGHFDRFEQVV